MSIIRQIRTALFGVTQGEFAEIAGVRQSTVSRWEAGISPTLDDLRRIRSAALERGLSWDDAFLFSSPSSADERLEA